MKRWHFLLGTILLASGTILAQEQSHWTKTVATNGFGNFELTGVFVTPITPAGLKPTLEIACTNDKVTAGLMHIYDDVKREGNAQAPHATVLVSINGKKAQTQRWKFSVPDYAKSLAVSNPQELVEASKLDIQVKATDNKTVSVHFEPGGSPCLLGR